jgi:outer membrane protein assembly factor BamB
VNPAIMRFALGRDPAISVPSELQPRFKNQPPPMFRISAQKFLITLCALSSAYSAPADWPQWRGPARNGSLDSGPALADSWGAEGPRILWDSELIPSDDDGGHGSPVLADGRVYLSVVWHSDEPSETRTITDLIMRVRLGHQNASPLGKELIEKIESARESLAPTLRGAKLEEFIEKFIQENLDRKKRELFGSWISSRFKKGKLAIPLGDYDKLKARVEKPFASQSEFEAWVNAQGFADHVKQAVLDAVPASKRVAEDTVICLDANSGKTIWITRAPGEPKGRNCSSTPCVAGGLVFAMGSTHLYAVNTETGKLHWSQPLSSKAPGSSPLVVDGVVFAQAGKLCAFDAGTGKPLWEQPSVTGSNASPTLWQDASTKLIVCNSRNELAGVDPSSGKIVWSIPGGGDSTPAIQGNLAAVLSSKDSIGFAGYQISATDAKQLWNHPTDARRSQSSPILSQGHAYLFEDNEHRCIHLASGKVAWTQKISSSITSPVMADAKIFIVTNNGNTLSMLRATPEERVELGKATIRALWVPSPSIGDGKLFVRHRQGVRCYDLSKAN